MARIVFPPLDSVIRTLLRIMAISLPFSVKLYSPGPDLEVIFPAEPLIGSIFLLFIASLFLRGKGTPVDRNFLKHPITLTVFAYVVASIVAAFFSTMPLVSAKALIVRTVYIAVFYFLIGSLPITLNAGAPALLKNYSIAFLPVMLYSFANQIEGGLDRASAGFVSFPFYSDHTIYAAALVFVLFMTAAAALRVQREGYSSGKALALWCIVIFQLVALYLSFCRAAWVSVAVAGVLLIVRVRKRLVRRVAVLVVLAGVVVGCAWGDRIMHLVGSSTVDSNAYRSGAKASILSLTNTTTDPSNKERLNRWNCAYRMFRDRPLTGFGPGTYQFQYLGYQQPDEMSPLSVADTVPAGPVTRSWTPSRNLFVRSNPQIFQYSGGTAHSEYLLALSESGMLAFAALVILVVLSITTGIRTLGAVTDPWLRSLATAATFCLAAYFVHAIFNNFLDDCKIAFLFWTSLALLVRLELEARSGRLSEN